MGRLSESSARALAMLAPPIAWATWTDARTGEIRRRALRSPADVQRIRAARAAAPAWLAVRIDYRVKRDAQADTDSSVW